jgi:transcriptional regulator with XRE-family HTH domain
MHLIAYGPKLGHSPPYQKRRHLARPDSLGRIFHNLRIHRNLTAAALAEKFGFSEDYVSAIESGSKSPSLKFCLLCGEEFGANPNWVKNKWANERIRCFSDRTKKRLGLDN